LLFEETRLPVGPIPSAEDVQIVLEKRNNLGGHRNRREREPSDRCRTSFRSNLRDPLNSIHSWAAEASDLIERRQCLFGQRLRHFQPLA
jgi:hypothetical protein